MEDLGTVGVDQPGRKHRIVQHGDVGPSHGAVGGCEGDAIDTGADDTCHARHLDADEPSAVRLQPRADRGERFDLQSRAFRRSLGGFVSPAEIVE